MLPSKKNSPPSGPDKPQKESTEQGSGARPASSKRSESARRTVLRPAVFTSALKSKDDTALVDVAWIKRRKTSELIELMGQILAELKGRTEVSTGDISATGEVPSFPEVEDADIKKFVRLPAAAAGTPEGAEANSWRIVLVSALEGHEPLGLEFGGEFTLGRDSVEKPVDLDLTPYNGETLGVSRLHAMLRPTRERLLLLDMGSTNGTFCNGERVRLGVPLEVKHNDTITFGGLHFLVKIVHQPGAGAKTAILKPDDKA